MAPCELRYHQKQWCEPDCHQSKTPVKQKEHSSDGQVQEGVERDSYQACGNEKPDMCNVAHPSGHKVACGMPVVESEAEILYVIVELVPQDIHDAHG